MPATPVLVRALHPPDPSGSWELTGFDRAVQWMFLRGTWVFPGGLDIERMKHGLARVLDDYPQLAGRMEKGQRVRFGDQGVPFSVVERPELVRQQLLDDHALAKTLMAKPSSGKLRRGAEAPMAVRVTELADAQVLSVVCAHACMDGTSFYSFVRNWGLACRGEPWPTPVLDPSRMPRNPARSKAEAKAAALEQGWAPVPVLGLVPTVWAMITGTLNTRSRPILLEPEDLARLRAVAEDGAGGLPLFDNDILTAYLLLQCARLVGLPAEARCTQVVVHDARGRVESLPPSFVGNASFSAIGAEHGPEDSLGVVAAAVHQALEPHLVRPSEATTRALATGLELMEHGLLLSHFDPGAMHAWRPTLCYLNNFRRLPIYEVDFGTASQPVRPLRVIPHDLPDPVLFWPPPPGQDGVELYLTARYAVAASKLADDDPWWRALRGR